MTFQEKLYQLRRERGYSQEQLARELGASRQAISRWEVVPDTANVLALCKFFSVSADALLREDTQPEPERNRDTANTASETDATAETDLDEEKQQLQRDIRSVNTGLLVRIAFLAACLGLHMWMNTGDSAWRFVFFVWEVIAVVGVAWWNHRWYFRDKGSFILLRWDVLLAVLGAFLPRVLSGIPGNWGTFLGVLPGVQVINLPIRTLLADHYRVEPPDRRKES